MNQRDEPWLTAAECAARTGLTVRALRVYEEYGLISPQRTASGWRCYGRDDLIRLNTITLLKSAGLSLAQIRTVTQLNDVDPSLQQVLEVQIETWKAKQAEAERGRHIVEAALKNLQSEHSLSIDELCNLVRNLAMSASASTLDGDDIRNITVDPKILDAYVGEYRWGEFAILEITREETQLFCQISGDQRHELLPESDTEFAARSLNAHIRFVTDSQGRATSQIIHQYGIRIEAPRLDAATAADMRWRLAARIASQTPLPGTEAALRRMLEGIETGELSYKEMSPLLARVLQQQMPSLQASARFLGPIKAIEFRGVGTQGWDVYKVRRERGAGEWRILLGVHGRVENAAVSATDANLTSMAFGQSDGVPSTMQPTPGSEAALRRLIDGIRSGSPNYDEMSLLLGQQIRQQLSQLQAMGQRLGQIVSIEHRDTIVERYDIYDMKREHGSTRWRISLGADGKITSAGAILTGTGLAAGP